MGDERAELNCTSNSASRHGGQRGRVAASSDGEAFADAAARLAGQAGVLFGWSPDAFWRATPTELAALGAALAGDPAASAPVDLAALMERFPDE